MTSIEPDTGTLSYDGFREFVVATEPPLRRALVATYGPDRGGEATAEALAWAWEHQDRLGDLDHPLRYLYRVGQSRTRFRRSRIPFVRSEWREPWVEPELDRALSRISRRQRTAVVLVHGHSWTLAEVAELLGISISSVQTHLDRALAALRSDLEVDKE